MTLPATTRRAGPFTGNGVTTAFPFTFKVFAKADISVVKTSSTGIESTLVLDSDYSVTLNADQEVSPGGTITYPVSGTPLSALEKLTAVGALTYEQPTDLPTGGNYSATTVENAFDRNVMLIQQLLERFARTLVYPVGDAASGTLPTLASRASKFLAFDAGGVPIGSAGVTALPVSTFMGTVLDDVDAATARTTLGAASDSFLQAGTGAVARTVQTKLRDVVHVLDFGADPTGAVSASTAFNDAMASLGAAGGVVDIGSGKYLLSTTINVPSNVTLRGRWLNPDLIGTSAIPAYQNAGSSLRLNSAATINLAVSAGIEQLLIYRSGMTFPIADTTAYAGTAITATGSNVSLRNLLVMGFNKLFYSTGHQRHFIDRVHGDNTNGLEIAASPDIDRISNCHMWPFAADTALYPNPAALRTGIAFHLRDVGDWSKLTNCFAYGYARGYTLNNVNSCTLLNCSADSNFPVTVTTALGFDLLGTSTDIRLIGCQAAAQGTGYHFATSAGKHNRMIGSDAWTCSERGVLIDSGDVSIHGGIQRGMSRGTVVNNASSRVWAGSVRFDAISVAPFSFLLSNGISSINDIDYGDFVGAVVEAPANFAGRSAASAGTMTLSGMGVLHVITGTTAISNINGGWLDRMVTLKFAAALTVVDGGNLNLAGNFVTSADDTLTLVFDGANWNEVARSVN